MGDNEQTPALPDQTHADLFDRLAEQPELERDAATAAGYPPREIQLAAYEAGVEAATKVIREWLAGRTVLEPPVQEQWCHFYGGPDPDNAAGNRICDDEVDAREASEWVVTLGGKGIARRMVRYGPWEVVDFTPDCLAEIKDGSDD